jgi:hypothetical protein
MKQQIITQKCEIASWGYYARLRTDHGTHITGEGTYGDTPEQAEANLRKMLARKKPETFSDRFKRDFQPTPADVIGLVFAALPIITLCVVAILAGGGK